MNIIDKLSAGAVKTWYKAHTLAKIDPGPGDLKCEFSKKDNKFRLYKFSEGFKWHKKVELPFNVSRDIEVPGMPRFILMIGNKPASYQFKQEGKDVYLHLKLSEWEYVIVFV